MSRIWKGFRIAGKQLVYLAIILLVIMMLFFGVLYWLSNAIEERQDEIEDWASIQLGYPVLIGDAGIHWLNMKPKLELDAISVLSKDKKSNIFSFDELYIGLDLVASFKQAEPVFNQVSLTGLKVALERDNAGELSVKGLESSPSMPKDNGSLFEWLQLLQRIHLQSVNIDYTDHNLPKLSGDYELVDAVIDHEKSHWQVQGGMQLPRYLGQKTQFQAELDVGKLLTLNQWQAELQTKGLNLDAFTPVLTWNDVQLEKGFLDFELSIDGSGQNISSIKSTITLSESKVISLQKENIPPVIIDKLSGDIIWQQQDVSWQLLGEKLQVNINGEAWEETSFTVNKKDDGAWLILNDYFRLSDLSAFAALSEHSLEVLRKQKPAGDVSHFALISSADKGITGLSFKLHDGAVNQWNEYPGVTGLSFDLDWNQGLAKVNFTSHNINLYANKWLKKSLFFDSLIGKVSWQQGEELWVFKSDGLHIWNDDLSLQLDGDIQKNNKGEIINDVSLILENIAVQTWKNYVPEKVLSKSFKEWSNRAFPAGKIVDGKIDWKGKVFDFPYKKPSDTAYFNMSLNVEGVQLHYAPGWPDLMGVKGTITGHGHNLIIKSKHGKIAGFDFVDAITIIKKLNENEPILTAKAELKGTTEKASLFIQNSPLEPRFGGVLKLTELKGKSNIRLDLMVPLADAEQTQVKGTVSFIGSELHSKLVKEIGINEINGQLDFDNQGVYAKQIKAKLFEEPIRINVKPSGDSTTISVLGKVATETINTIYPNKLPSYIRGGLSYRTDITVQEKALGDFYVNYDVSSDLKGLEIDLPEPFSKKGTQARAFTASMKTIDNNEYAVKYGDILHAVILPQNKQGKNKWRGAIQFGQKPLKLPSHGINVRGELATVSVDDWLKWSKKMDGNSENYLINSIDNISMSIGRLSGFNQTLTSLNYSAEKDLQGWRVKLSSDQTKGSLYLPLNLSGKTDLEVTLDKLILSSGSDETKKEQEKGAVAKSVLWPAMKINIGLLKIDDMKLGKLSLQASRQHNIWKLNSASLKSTSFNAHVVADKSQWQQTKIGNETRLTVEASSNNLSQLMRNFGYQDIIESEKVALYGDLSWANSPLEFSMKALKGTANIKVGKGKLKDVEPGAAGRIFGLMSVAALPRRLALDFSDLFSKGFSFDAITGDFSFTNGLATSDNFSLRGAAADIDITGSIDLINQQYNQHVKVTPNVSSTLPLAGAVAGGPVGLGVGTAILVIDKLADSLFGKNIVNIISYNYALTGPWDKPELGSIKPKSQ